MTNLLPFKADIPLANLSRKNQEVYQKIQDFHGDGGIKKCDSPVATIGGDGSLTATLEKGLTHSKQRQAIAREDAIINEATLAIINETERALANEFALITCEEADDDESASGPAFTFAEVYTPTFLQKISNGIQKDSEFRKPIALGVWEQYKAVKNYVTPETGKTIAEDVADQWGNTPFMYANLFTMEGVNRSISLPLDKATKEKLEELHDLGDLSSLLVLLKQSPQVVDHYALLKDAFTRNVLNIILQAQNPEYMYEAFVRTDLLRRQIKSVGSLESGFQQLLLLANALDDQKMVAILEHLLYACIAHKHTDGTNSNDFKRHTTHCLFILGKDTEIGANNLERYTERNLRTLV